MLEAEPKLHFYMFSFIAKIKIMSLNVDNSDVQLMETYQHRIAQIQNVSDVIAVANLQLNKALQKFGWSRQKFLKDVSNLLF